MGHCLSKNKEGEHFIEKKIDLERNNWDGLTEDGLIDLKFSKELFNYNFNLVEIGL